MRIAAIQQDHNPGKVEENRAKAVAYAKQAVAGHADIILFHEELLIGYHKDMKKLAETLHGETTQAFQQVLKGTDAKIIYGLTEREGDKYYISAPVVTESGVIANYRKTHLYWKAQGTLRDEAAQFTAGDALTVFEHKGHKIGILLCYDGDFPEMFRTYARLGCSVVLWLNNRTSRGHRDCCTQAAHHNSLIVATTCNCGLDESGIICEGLSNIVNYDGKLLGELSMSEGIVWADVDPAQALETRKSMPTYVGLRPELYTI